MEYSIFPTERSAVKWASENLGCNKYIKLEIVKEAGYEGGKIYGKYHAGEYWLWYRESDIKPIPAEWKHLVSDWVQNG